MSIGENIKKIRELRNMTQQELANSINLSRSYLGDLENDRRNPSMETIKRLAQKLDVSLIYLVEGTPALLDTVPDDDNQDISFGTKIQNTIVNDTILRLNNLSFNNIDKSSLIAISHYLGLLDYKKDAVSDFGMELIDIHLETTENLERALSHIPTLLYEDNVEDFEYGFEEIMFYLTELKAYPEKLTEKIEQLEDEMWQLRDDFLESN